MQMLCILQMQNSQKKVFICNLSRCCVWERGFYVGLCLPATA